MDPIIDGLQFTQVLMEGGSDLNLLYPNTIHKLGIDLTKLRHSRTSFKGVTPGPYAKCTGSLLLEVVFGSPNNFRREKLIFHVALFKSSYQALLGREDLSALTPYHITRLVHLKCPVHVASFHCEGHLTTPDTVRRVRHK